MKYLTVFLISFGAFTQTSHDHPEVARNYPWAKNRFTYHAVFKTVNAQGQTISETPAPGQWINMVIADDESSGYHSHGSDANPRPPQIPFALRTLNAGESPIRLQTDANGDAVFAWRGNWYSGTVTTLLVADDLRFPIEKFHEYLAYTDWEQSGASAVAHYLKPAPNPGDLMGFTRHDDGRHLNSAGLTGNSRYATINSLASVEVLAYFYRTHHMLGLQLDLIRASLPDGGCADNKMLAGGTTAYQYLPWLYKACNGLGVEFDFENPAIQAGGVGTPLGDYSYGLFELGYNKILRCKAAQFMDDGVTPIVNPYGTSGYWYQQPVVRIVCSLAPQQKPQ